MTALLALEDGMVPWGLVARGREVSDLRGRGMDSKLARRADGPGACRVSEEGRTGSCDSLHRFDQLLCLLSMLRLCQGNRPLIMAADC